MAPGAGAQAERKKWPNLGFLSKAIAEQQAPASTVRSGYLGYGRTMYSTAVLVYLDPGTGCKDTIGVDILLFE